MRKNSAAYVVSRVSSLATDSDISMVPPTREVRERVCGQLS